MKPAFASAVTASRVEPPDSLDYFPTPPWATRALFRHVIGLHSFESVWEPACGQGHMSCVLHEYFGKVYATDIFGYPPIDWRLAPRSYRQLDFLSDEAFGFGEKVPHDWIITNPPFKVALDFTLRALVLAKHGVAMLARTQWVESKIRYARLFQNNPPSIIAPFVERVGIVKGCWDPVGVIPATSYAWFVWIKNSNEPPIYKLIPPCKVELTEPDDIKRFGKRIPAPLLGESA